MLKTSTRHCVPEQKDWNFIRYATSTFVYTSLFTVSLSIPWWYLYLIKLFFILRLSRVQSREEKEREIKKGKKWLRVDKRMEEDIKFGCESVRILLSISNIKPGRRIKRQELETDWLFYCKKIIVKNMSKGIVFIWLPRSLLLMDAHLIYPHDTSGTHFLWNILSVFFLFYNLKSNETLSQHIK